MSKLILYNYFRSSTSYRVRMALHFKGLDFEYRPVHLLNNGGEQNQPEYRKINPIGGVPALVDGDFVLAQSLPIIEYIDEKFPQPPLFPKDLQNKSLVRQVCENINCDIHPMQNLKVLGYLQSEFKITDEQKSKWIDHWITKGFAATEQIIAKTTGTYAFGDSVTAADIFITAQVVTAQRFNVSFSQHKTIAKVFENTTKLEAFQKAHPKNQPDTPPEMR